MNALPSLAQLVAAQQAHNIFAYSLDEDAQLLARLRRTYARKRAELATVRDFFQETAPDIVLRAPDGRQVSVRLSDGEVGNVLAAIHESLSTTLRRLEEETVRLVHDIEQVTLDKRHATAEEQQDAQIGLAILALCAPNDPALAAYASPASHLRNNVWAQRSEAAWALEEKMQEKYEQPEGRFGREILWHPSFPAEYVASISGLPLVEVVELHENMDNWANQGRPLDQHDYAYLRDVLTEALASRPTELATLRLRRALAWVEQASAAPATLPAPARPRRQPVVEPAPLEVPYGSAQPDELALAA